ncbi:MAG: monofunctional biosynthetic peptidoglycan transglycosylase [Acidobacteria bacterium]|nr:monofunctional biosynthetic peptidoglycan transglycosylase [Acidobacteriota bacterium]
MRKVLRGLALAAALGFVFFGYIYLTLPDVRPLATTNPETTAFMQLRTREAAEVGKRYSVRHRWMPYSQISSNLRRAVLVAEDSAFFDHDGVDLKEFRASLEANWEEGRFARGASTITQQLAKNLYLSESRNPIRKVTELLITRRLEAALTKRRILEIYLNVIEWGDGIFGAEAASRVYFGKSSSALSQDEAALLAGAIINPRVHSPANPTSRLRRRQQIIARRMGVKPSAQTIQAPKTPSGIAPGAPTSTTETPQPSDQPVRFFPMNRPPPAPHGPARPVQPRSGNGVPAPVTPTISSSSI